MKYIIVLGFLAVALAAPQGNKMPIEIISSNSKMNADGSYSLRNVSGFLPRNNSDMLPDYPTR
ncbi:hypothetical protein OUZ56_021916 [Daphnia magna]|uniref:Uncharacterized protein n=1 Tax=Daphnia magna TaxID=35525 RepID=A0ABR0AUT7_9CRUS|nr:hypothetical protein OUZ56_021916 [Daphnia magna]